MLRQRNYLFKQRLAWSALIALLFILVKGYSFNGGDQEEHLPFVYKLLDPQLYPSDYLVPFQVSYFTVRYFYAHLIAFCTNWFPVSGVVLFLHFTLLMIFTASTGALAARIARSELAFVLAPSLALLIFNDWTTGGNSIMDYQLTSSVFAMAFGAVGARMAYLRKFNPMAFFAGLAALFQVLIGLQLFLILLVLVAGINRRAFPLKDASKSVAVFLLTASPMLLPVFRQQLFSEFNYDHDLYNFILFEFRNAHHYIPSAFPNGDYIRTILISGGASLILLLGFFNEFRRYFFWLAGVVIAGAAVYYLGFEVLGYAAIGKLQWFKSTAWLSWAASIVLAAYLTSFRFAFKAESILTTYGTALPLAIMLPVLLFVNSGDFIHPKVAQRYQFSGKPVTDLQKMHVWIRENTAVEKTFVIPPDDDRFLCEAQRSVPVAWKGIIHEPWFLIPWYRSFKMVYGNAPLDAVMPEYAVAVYRSRPDSLIQLLVKPDFRLMDLSIPGPALPDSQVVHREGNMVLLRFISP